jgi:hypothetical protein
VKLDHVRNADDIQALADQGQRGDAPHAAAFTGASLVRHVVKYAANPGHGIRGKDRAR